MENIKNTKPAHFGDLVNKKFDYLNLEITNPVKRVITLDKQKHICYLKNDSFKHELHSESTHLNSITDLIIELGDSLQWYNEKFYNLVSIISNYMLDKNKRLKQIMDNQDYFKTSLRKIEDLDYTLKKLTNTFEINKLKNLPEKQDILNLKKLIEENKYKEVELQSKDLLNQIKQQSESIKTHFDIEIKRLENILIDIRNIQLN